MAKSETSYKQGHSGLKRENNPMWKGKKAGYVAIHTWLRTNFGKPTQCENKLCVYPRKNKGGKLIIKPKRFEYALKHGKNYEHNRTNFIILCTSCHQRYDKTGYKKT